MCRHLAAKTHMQLCAEGQTSDRNEGNDNTLINTRRESGYREHIQTHIPILISSVTACFVGPTVQKLNKFSIMSQETEKKTAVRLF